MGSFRRTNYLLKYLSMGVTFVISIIALSLEIIVWFIPHSPIFERNAFSYPIAYHFFIDVILGIFIFTLSFLSIFYMAKSQFSSALISYILVLCSGVTIYIVSLIPIQPFLYQIVLLSDLIGGASIIFFSALAVGFSTLLYKRSSGLVN